MGWFEHRFADRRQAGRALARRLEGYRSGDVLVLGLPRGGVPVAYEVACALDAPLDVCAVRKLGLPGHQELAMGAIATGGDVVLEPRVLAAHRVDPAELEAVIGAERTELERREREYRGDRPPPDVAGRTVILIDDGLATGSTMRAAARSLRTRAPARLVIAVPVAPAETCQEMRAEADEVICDRTPRWFQAVGAWYEDFSPTTDAEVKDLLARASTKEHAR
jgi:putative phosphoribosyl transferase